MQPLFEALEGRNLFSVTPIGLGPQPQAEPAILVHPLVAIKKMKGTWSGAVLVTGIHTQSISLKITSQTSSGKLKGVLIATADPSIQVAFTGKIKSNRKVSITLTGGHSGGAINGTGTGKLSANGKAITFTMVFVQNGMSFPGTLTLTKV